MTMKKDQYQEQHHQHRPRYVKSKTPTSPIRRTSSSPENKGTHQNRLHSITTAPKINAKLDQCPDCLTTFHPKDFQLHKANRVQECPKFRPPSPKDPYPEESDEVFETSSVKSNDAKSETSSIMSEINGLIEDTALKIKLSDLENIHRISQIFLDQTNHGKSKVGKTKKSVSNFQDTEIMSPVEGSPNEVHGKQSKTNESEANDKKDQPKKFHTRPPSPKQPYPGDRSSHDEVTTHQRLPPQIVPYPESKSVQDPRSKPPVQASRPTLTNSTSITSEVIQNGFKVPESPKPEQPAAHSNLPKKYFIENSHGRRRKRMMERSLTLDTSSNILNKISFSMPVPEFLSGSKTLNTPLPNFSKRDPRKRRLSEPFFMDDR